MEECPECGGPVITTEPCGCGCGMTLMCQDPECWWDNGRKQ